MVLSNKFAFETLCILLFMWWAHGLIDAVRLKFRMPWILFDVFQNYKPLDAKILVRDKSQWVAVVGRHYQWLLLPQQPNIHSAIAILAALEILHQHWRNTLLGNRRICICSAAHKNRRGRGRATTNCNDPFARSTQLAACARINIAKTHQQYHPHCHCHGYYISHIQCQYTLCFFLLSSLLYQLCESLVFIKTNLFVSRLLIQDPIIVPIGSNLMTSCTWLLNVENIHFPLKLKEVFAILGQNGFPKLNFSHF